MLPLHRAAAILGGVWVGAGVTRLGVDWALNLPRGWVLALMALGAALGGLASVSDARALEPMEPAERRDWLLGWGTVVGGVAATFCLALPLPWGPAAAVAVVGATLPLLRRLP